MVFDDTTRATFLREAAAAMDEAAQSEDDAVDALRLACGVLCELFAQLAPEGTRLPAWCAPMTLAGYPRTRLRASPSLSERPLGPQPPQQRPPPAGGLLAHRRQPDRRLRSLHRVRPDPSGHPGLALGRSRQRRREDRAEPGAYGGVSWEERTEKVVVGAVNTFSDLFYQ